MAVTLLVGTPGASWREWLHENLAGRHFLNLDPGDPAQDPPARIALFHNGKPTAWCFFGGLEAERAPHLILSALQTLLPLAQAELVVQLFPLKGSPLMVQVARSLVQALQPSEIVVPEGAALPNLGGPNPTPVTLPEPLSPQVHAAQRKARWLKLLESCTEQLLRLDQLRIEGARLGAGASHPPTRAAAEPDELLHVETTGHTVLIVSESEPSDALIARTLDRTHASRAVLATPASYQNLLVAFARESGEDFAIGILQEIDFKKGTVTLLADSVPPSPVKILRIGVLRLSPTGDELGRIEPWQV